MMNRLIELLNFIDSGQQCFKPESSSEEDLRVFQDDAKFLKYANDEELITNYKPKQESRSGNRWYVMVMVLGGLTIKGKNFLRSESLESLQPGTQQTKNYLLQLRQKM